MSASSAPDPSPASPSPLDDPSANPLHRGLGVSSIVLMVVAGAAPLAVVAATTPILISVGGNIGAPLFFVIAAVVLVLFSVGFTLMSRHVRNAGAFYSYVQAGLGRVNGVGAAMLALVSYTLLLIGLYTYFGVAAQSAITRFTGVETPWWAWALMAFAIVGFLGYRDIELSSKVLGCLLIAETAVVLILDAAIFVNGGSEGFSAAPLNPVAALAGTPSTAIMFAFFTFIGFEATAVFRNEAKDPERTIPRATYLAVIFIGVVYAVSSFAVIIGTGVNSALDVAQNNTADMVFDLYTEYTGVLISDVTQVLLVTSFFACALTFHNVLTRYQYTLGSLKVLPPQLAQVSPKHESPARSSLTMTAVSGVFLLVMIVSGLDPVTQIYTWFSGAATIGLLILMALTSAAVIAFFRAHRVDTRAWNTVIAPSLAGISLTAVVVLVLVKIDLLIPNPTAAWAFLVILGAAYLVGLGIAIRMRRNRPGDYAGLHSEER